MVRDNFTANLLSYAGEVMRDNAEAYKTQVGLAQKAGMPIYQHDLAELDKAVKAQAEAQAQATAKAKAQAVTEAETITEREAVAV
jgi:cbb3-type cytochrome oxidase cytochrome c subunit